MSELVVGTHVERPQRFRLDLSYDGTDFHGWARQPGLRTVQGVLEDALQRVLGPQASFAVVVAGRTDAGVHARGQVAHVDISGSHRLSAAGSADGVAGGLARKLGSVLTREPDLIVHRASPALPGFDARFSATGRAYTYRIADAGAEWNPLRRRDTLHTGVHLDEAVMHAMARNQIGFRDWAAFCKPRDGATTLRTLTEFSWRRDAEGVLVASIAADAFCHNMVRYLVGASVAVGRGRLQPAEVDAIRESGHHSPAVVVVPPHGLTLVQVTYPETALEMAEQVERARARRSVC